MSNPNRTMQFKIDFRIFSITLLVAMVPLVAGTWWLSRSYESSALETTGRQLSDTAELASHSINGYLQHQIMATASLAEVPELRDAVLRKNVEMRGNLDEIRKQILTLEGRWDSLDLKSEPVTATVDNPTSRFLRRYASVNRHLREILVTDFLGRTVAATSKSEKHYHALSDWWRETYGDGIRGGGYVGDVHFDRLQQVYAIDLAQPLVDEKQGVFGAIRVVLDIQEIHALLGAISGNPGTMIALIRAKGDVISAAGYRTSDQTLFPATLGILNAREHEKSYFISDGMQPAIYGLARTNLSSNYPHLNWILTARRETKEALGPWPTFKVYFLALFLLFPLPAILAILMLTRALTRPVIEGDPHLERL